MNEQTADAAVALAEQHLERGEPLLAYNSVQAGLERWPGHARLRQLQALALARSGDIERANAILDKLAREGIDDAETLGMLARTHKDLALIADGDRRSAHLRAGFQLYEQAYRTARKDGADAAASYTGINAATMAVLMGDLPRARDIAGDVREVCARVTDAHERYWREATLGEAALILGDPDAAVAHYAQAAKVAGRRYGDVSTTRRQARLLRDHLPRGRDVTEALRVPPILVFTGHMIDQPQRRAPRFPPALESRARDAIRSRLEAIRPVAGYGAAACGADLLCLEALRELGCETHVILPFPAAEFRRVSVEFANADWGERFDRALAAADSVTITSDHFARGSVATFEYANLVLTGMGRLRAQVLDTSVQCLAIWDPKASGEIGGSASIVSLWKERDLAVDHIDLGELRGDTARGERASPATTSPAPGDVRHEMRALLFADAVGYSQLSEDQIPGYISGFLGAVAELNRRTTHRFEHVETSGDGLYMVFRSVSDAAHYALELSALTNAFDRAACGLPPTFNLRIALHCGPVHCGRDPITGSPIYTGPHTSRAARIEPITPPGQVYASSAFAAVAAASGGGFIMHYVGRMPLAKSYGTLGLYHVRSVRQGSMR